MSCSLGSAGTREEAALFVVTEIAMKWPPANINTYSPIRFVGMSSCNIEFVSSEVTVLLEGGLFTSNTLIVSRWGQRVRILIPTLVVVETQESQRDDLCI